MNTNRFWYCLFKTSWGWCGIVRSRRGLVRTVFPHPHRNVVEREILRAYPAAEPSTKGLSRARRELCRYFDGKRVALTFPLDISGFPPFRRKALRAATAIPYGEVRTYGDVAKQAGNPRASRAVGAAMAHNPLPPIIPCHRVVASGGKLGGFSAKEGIKLKARLLAHEGLGVREIGNSYRLQGPLSEKAAAP